MEFCESCNVAFEGERCPVCGTKKLRQAREDDFCFLLEDDALRCNVIMGVLESNEIPYSAMPFGNGVEARVGMPLGNYRVFVPFVHLERAKSLLRDLENENTEQLRAQLLENAKSFNIPPKVEKKLRKKLKLPADIDFIAYCVDIVKGANKIVDEKCIGMQWRYVFCYSDETSVTLNSKTFEILAVRKKDK